MSKKPSKRFKTFDLEDTLNRLGKLARERTRAPKDVAAIRAAALAIQFIQVHGKLHNYVDYLQDMDNALKRLSRTVASFDNMGKALTWLAGQTEPRFGARVDVAGKPYVVVRQRNEVWFLIPAPPIPSYEELTGETS